MTQILDDDYKNWIFEIKSKIRSAQMKAALSVNAAIYFTPDNFVFFTKTQ